MPHGSVCVKGEHMKVYYSKPYERQELLPCMTFLLKASYFIRKRQTW